MPSNKPCGGPHFNGCACHEREWQKKVDALKVEIARLTDYAARMYKDGAELEAEVGRLTRLASDLLKGAKTDVE